MQEKLLKSGLAAVFGLSVLGAVGILTGRIDLGADRVYELSEYAAVVGFVALAGGALLSGRSIDSYELWEMVSVAVAATTLAVMYLGEPVAAVDLIENHHPWTGATAAAVSYLGYYLAALR